MSVSSHFRFSCLVHRHGVAFEIMSGTIKKSKKIFLSLVHSRISHVIPLMFLQDETATSEQLDFQSGRTDAVQRASGRLAALSKVRVGIHELRLHQIGPGVDGSVAGLPPGWYSSQVGHSERYPLCAVRLPGIAGQSGWLPGGG